MFSSVYIGERQRTGQEFQILARKKERTGNE